MRKHEERVHFYHADANAFGGRIDRPFEEVLPILSPLSLPAVGGYASARHEKYRLRELISIENAYTQVAGSYSEDSQSWTTLVTSVVEGVNINNYVQVDRLVAQISTDHPSAPGSYTPTVSLRGTQVLGLKVGGEDVAVRLNLNIVDSDNLDKHGYPETSPLGDRSFLDKIGAQYRKMERKGPFRQRTSETEAGFDWLSRYRWHESESPTTIQTRGMALCSVVEEISDISAGTVYGHAIEIPEFGNVFLGELLVDNNSFDLTMLRLELGCPVKGVVAMSRGKANGSTAP